MHSEDTTWAVVGSGSLRLICKIKKHVCPGECEMVHEALALDNDITRVPVQTDRGNHVMFVADPMVKPVDMEKVPVKVLCRVDNIRYFHDMPDQGAHLTRAYQVCVDQLVKQRAAAANIHVPPGVSGSGRA